MEKNQVRRPRHRTSSLLEAPGQRGSGDGSDPNHPHAVVVHVGVVATLFAHPVAVLVGTYS